MAKKIGKPSWHQEFADKMPNSFRERAKYIQDFAKHGFKDVDEAAQFDTIFAEALMFVSVERHADIFGSPMRPLLALYWARTFREHPDWIGDPSERFPQVIIESGIIDDIARGSRKVMSQ